MPERPDSPRWILLGRVLPRRTRERVFEPAFYDLLRWSLLSGRHGRVWFGGHVLAIFGGSLVVGLRGAIFTRRRLMMIGVVLALLGIVLIMLLRTWLLGLYGVGAEGQYR